MSSPDKKDARNDESGWGDAWGDDGWGDAPSTTPVEDEESLAKTQALNPVSGPLNDLDRPAARPPSSPSMRAAGPPAVPSSHAPPPFEPAGKAAASGAPIDHLPPRKNKDAPTPGPAPAPGASSAPAPGAAASAAPTAAPTEHLPPRKASPGEAMTTTGDAAGITAVEIEEGKTMAALCHAANVFGIPLWVLPLFIQKNNAYAIFHAKQAAAGSVVYWVGWVIVSIIGSLTCGVGLIFGLALPIIGIWPAIWAWNGQVKRLPLIGDTAADIFKNIHADKAG